MIEIASLSLLRTQLAAWRQQGHRIAFVPTMGNLHRGHLSLVETAKRHADKVIVSIFVNPTQFNDKQDLAAYPRTLSEDRQQLADVDCDAIFIPSVEVMYPTGLTDYTTVNVPVIADRLCGAHRPGHFDGVATVVTKLFNLVQADVAVFGEKDYQQLLLIKKLVKDLNFPVEIIGAKTYREENGLAMSSRNQYLSTTEKEKAGQLYVMLMTIQHAIMAGRRDFTALCQQASQQLTSQGFEPEYIEVCRTDDLQLATTEDKALRIVLAARLGSARLIDNIACNLA